MSKGIVKRMPKDQARQLGQRPLQVGGDRIKQLADWRTRSAVAANKFIFD